MKKWVPLTGSAYSLTMVHAFYSFIPFATQVRIILKAAMSRAQEALGEGEGS